MFVNIRDINCTIQIQNMTLCSKTRTSVKFKTMRDKNVDMYNAFTLHGLKK